MIFQTIKNVHSAFRAVLVFTVMTGLLYPFLMTFFARVLFPYQASGSLILRSDIVIGSELIAQKFSSQKYFYPRPSAADFATTPSGASNLSPTSETLKLAVLERRNAFGQGVPVDLLSTSGSGLDPHISPEAARFQLERIIKARSMSPVYAPRIDALIQEVSEAPQFGFLGSPRVNVLKLNLRLDQAFP